MSPEVVLRFIPEGREGDTEMLYGPPVRIGAKVTVERLEYSVRLF